MQKEKTSLKSIVSRVTDAINEAWDETTRLVAKAHIESDQVGVKQTVPVLLTLTAMRDQLAKPVVSASTPKRRVRRSRAAKTEVANVVVAKPQTKGTSTKEKAPKGKRTNPEKGTYTTVGEYRTLVMRAFGQLGGRAPFREVQARVIDIMKNEGLVKPLDLETSQGTSRVRAYAQMSALLQQMKQKGEVKAHGEGASAEIEFVGFKPSGRPETKTQTSTKVVTRRPRGLGKKKLAAQKAAAEAETRELVPA